MKQHGFTLIELMVAVSIIGVVLLAVTQMLVQSLVGAAKAEAITRVKNNGDTALVAMSRAIREGQNIDMASNPNPIQFKCDSGSGRDRFRFINFNGEVIIIQKDNTTGRLEIEVNGNSRFITEKDVIVSDLNFTCPKPVDGRRDKVRIAFMLAYNGGARASKNVATTFYTSVMMRNKVNN